MGERDIGWMGGMKSCGEWESLGLRKQVIRGDWGERPKQGTEGHAPVGNYPEESKYPRNHHILPFCSKRKKTATPCERKGKIVKKEQPTGLWERGGWNSVVHQAKKTTVLAPFNQS